MTASGKEIRGLVSELRSGLTGPEEKAVRELLADRIETAVAEEYPPILDITCGSKMIWFDKDCPDVLYCDNREVDGEAIWKGNSRKGTSVRHLNVHPDVIADFTALPFPDETFRLAVFDPPHLEHIGENAWMCRKYGKLRKGWQTMLRDGFRECMRVLKPEGTLVFKWSEIQIPVGKVWEAIGHKPLFGTRCGKTMKTIWAVFMKGVPACPCSQDSR